MNPTTGIPATPPRVFAFECRLTGSPHTTIINSTSRGKAKVKFFHKLDGDFPFVSLRVRKIGPAHTSEAFLRNATYRGIPDARCGDAVIVGNARGVIVGHNDSANFDIQFDQDTIYRGQVLNVHPQDVKLLKKQGEADA